MPYAWATLACSHVPWGSAVMPPADAWRVQKAANFATRLDACLVSSGDRRSSAGAASVRAPMASGAIQRVAAMCALRAASASAARAPGQRIASHAERPLRFATVEVALLCARARTPLRLTAVASLATPRASVAARRAMPAAALHATRAQRCRSSPPAVAVPRRARLRSSTRREFATPVHPIAPSVARASRARCVPAAGGSATAAALSRQVRIRSGRRTSRSWW